LNAKAPDKFQAKFTTTKGDFVISVEREWAPIGADRFYNLVKNGYYDGTAFFRVVPGFVVQWGIHPDPKIAAAWRSAPIQDEPVKQGNLRGFVTYAKGGPNTRTTQLFINYVDNSRLDGMGFPAFGKVTEGMDVVDQIFPGYGESPNQGAIQQQGAEYLEKEYPKLDVIQKAVVIEPAAPAKPAPAKTTPAKPSTAKPATTTPTKKQ
jgi:peptidyl-prolyl cis-trans isomerase A (cyclophilin A)